MSRDELIDALLDLMFKKVDYITVTPMGVLFDCTQLRTIIQAPDIPTDYQHGGSGGCSAARSSSPASSFPPLPSKRGCTVFLVCCAFRISDSTSSSEVPRGEKVFDLLLGDELRPFRTWGVVL